MDKERLGQRIREERKRHRYTLEALATKARAMYGRRLRRAELARIARLGSVQEVLAELCQQPAWAQAAQALAGEPLVTRARLEDALRGQVRQ